MSELKNDSVNDNVNHDDNVNDADNNDSVMVDLDQYKDMDWDLLVSSGNGVGSSGGGCDSGGGSSGVGISSGGCGSGDGGKDVLQFIPRNDDGKRFHILSTIEMMRKVVETDTEMDYLFKKLLDKVCHTAPEILDIRWKDIYHFCLHYFGNLEDERGWSQQILQIYNSRIRQYNALFK